MEEMNSYGALEFTDMDGSETTSKFQKVQTTLTCALITPFLCFRKSCILQDHEAYFCYACLAR